MHTDQILSSYKSVLQLLMIGQLKSAFSKTKMLAIEFQNGSYSDRLEELQQNYSYLLHYYTSGVNDPQRKQVYNKLIAKTYLLLSEVKEELLQLNSSGFEYNQKRHFLLAKDHVTPNSLFEKLTYFHNQSEILFNTEDKYQGELKRLHINYELSLVKTFNLFWLTSTYNSEYRAFFNNVLADEDSG